MSITFYNADVKFILKQKKELKGFIQLQASKEGKQIKNISYIFCSDEYLLNINRQFLNHDYYTDIITFPLSDDKKHIESEIYISVDRVNENSKQFATSKGLKPLSGLNHQFQSELHRVMFHGILHLLGYKDKTKTHKAEMRKMEDLWLKRFILFASQ